MNRTPTARGASSASPETARPLTLRCRGARGSIPSPGPATAGYGGNTPCLELLASGRRYVFDAGTGLRPLGQDLLDSGEPLEATIFLTHFHWDHIQGFPFFEPLYRPGADFRIVGPMQQNTDIRSLFARQMGPIHFPVPFSAVAASTSFAHLNEGSWSDGVIEVEAMRMRHPSFTVGYRITAAGRRIGYVPDNDLRGEGYDVDDGWREQLVGFLRHADLLLHDAMYTEDEYPSRRGWGHSTFDQCLDLAQEAGVARLLFFHHAPWRTDDALDREVERGRERVSRAGGSVEVDAAREGPVLSV